MTERNVVTRNISSQKNAAPVIKKPDTVRKVNAKEKKATSNNITTININNKTQNNPIDNALLSRNSLLPTSRIIVPQVKAVQIQKKVVVPKKQTTLRPINNIQAPTTRPSSPTAIILPTTATTPPVSTANVDLKKKVTSPKRNVLASKNTTILSTNLPQTQKQPLPSTKQIEVPKSIKNIQPKTVVKRFTICDSVKSTNNNDIKITTTRRRSLSAPNKKKTIDLPISSKQQTVILNPNILSNKINVTPKEMAEKFTSVVLSKELIGLKKEFETNFPNCKISNKMICQEAQKNENKNINPSAPLLNNSRVILKNNPNNNNYINANYVATCINPNRLILTQYPMDNTIEDFFQMIIQENIQYVIQLASRNELEDPSKGVEYIPTNKTLSIKNINIFNVNETISKTDENIKITTVMFKYNGKEYNFKHILWIKWPKNGCPKPYELTTVTIYEYVSKTTNPILIHCRSGIRRSGMIAGIFMAMDDFTTNKFKDNMIDIVKNLRNHRALCIRTVVEYYFLHLQMIHYFLKKDYISNSQQLMELMDDYDPANKKQAEIEKQKFNISAFGITTLKNV
uniref:Tyrosine-protein phosphatase n=1 Tax=Strongyloides stercoralis TaxID=6248 RepID=A0A0K0DZY3_STRER